MDILKQIFRKTKVSDAKYLAMKEHGMKTYGDYPYFYHLELVVQVLTYFGFTDERFIISGFLHDIIEDCGLTFNDIKNQFGKEIAEIVWAVSGFGINRKERTACVIPKIKANDDALIVKLADRIANTYSSIKSNPNMANTYRYEFINFKDKLYNGLPEADPMWDYLENLTKEKNDV